MPAYHSSFIATAPDAPVCASLAMLPVSRLPAGRAGANAAAAAAAAAATDAPPEYEDIIEEALAVFRANVLFRNFEMLGAADRTLVYLLLFISECLTKVPARASREEATRVLYGLTAGQFAIPGDHGFPLNAMYTAPKNRSESDTLRSYISQLRSETYLRLLDRLYLLPDGSVSATPSKWWMCFAKRKFMNKSL